MNKSVKIIKPSCITGFKCTGGDCEDSCCIGWDIDIDKLTFRKYFRTKDMEMKQEFKRYVYKNEECDCEEVNYGGMHITETKWCPFLNDDKLCRIYSNLGEDYLSNVCHSFPRVYNVLDGVYELSLSLSCPEAVKKMLASRDAIKFIEEEVPLDKHIVYSYIDTRDKNLKGSPVRRLKELRNISIKMIQDRKLSIGKRLLNLGFKLGKIQLLETSNMSHSNDPIKVAGNYMFQTGFFRNALESLQVFTEIDSPVFVEYTQKVVGVFSLQENTTLNEQAALYEKAMRKVVEPFIKENGYLFEHYLANSMFQGNFPFTVNQNIFDGYLMLVVRYTFIRFYLAGIAALKGKLTVEDVALMIQVHTKAISHHKTFIQDLLEDIKEKQFDSMEFVSILLG